MSGGRVRHFEVLAFRCDAEGIVEQVVADDLALDHKLAAGESMLTIIDPLSHEKARQFLHTIVSRQAASGWELTVLTGGRPFPATFTGAMQGDTLFVIVGRSARDITDVVETLEHINNEQLNAFRSAFRDQRDAFDRRTRSDALAYEELTRVNNELSNAQRELARQSSELARLNEEKNRFLGMAAHDLRSPLTVIAGYATLLAHDEKSDPEKLRMYEDMAAASRFMLDLINDLLDIARIEARKHDISVSTFDAVDVVRQKISAYVPFANAKNIAIHITGDAAIDMTSDADKLRQIVGNLVGNAIKYSNPNTTIEIGIRSAAGFLHLEVKDQGIGIPADQLERIFEPFVRLVTSGTAGERSTGLGLSIVAQIVAAIGGTISVESEVGVGSTFRVMAPLSFQNASIRQDGF
ncbi:MAG TPA: HAMP domain-containing sensor histidine kinase [Thermoanaerobaculia bacterium]|nr:HAMP domain-containing sensor histidine kinase [Thermoanaerobaculia bacterium]